MLRQHIADESIDLVYLDPPFNSNANYNVLFAERDGTQAAAQIKVFDDTWRWDEGSARAYEEIVETGGKISRAMQAFRTFLGDSDMLAYLAMMCPRLIELRRVLKPSGSIWLHCDPNASHYLKMLMDAIFGPEHFRNEIAWQRSTAKSHAFTRFPVAQDTLLYYGKSDGVTWHPAYLPHRDAYIESHYSNIEEGTGRHYTLGDCLNPNPDRPNLKYQWHGQTRVWRWTKERMQANHDAGRLVYTKSGMTRYKRYLDEMPGTPVTSMWTDIPPINSQAQERLGYPTQKPEALLDRIIKTSSNEGDVVIDPFCGCGTTIASAQRLNRKWVGIDITNLAITLIKKRLLDANDEDITSTYETIGEPISVQDAEALAASDPYQFQWWALGLVGARPAEGKKGADQGIDGRIYFHEGDTGSATKQIILSVKAGKLHAPYVRDLRGVVEREKAAIGVLLSLDEPTKAMRTEAASAGFYTSLWGQHPRLQIVTVGELLAGKKVDIPPIRQTSVTHKRAPKVQPQPPKQQKLPILVSVPAAEALEAASTAKKTPARVEVKPRAKRRRLRAS